MTGGSGSEAGGFRAWISRARARVCKTRAFEDEVEVAGSCACEAGDPGASGTSTGPESGFLQPVTSAVAVEWSR